MVSRKSDPQPPRRRSAAHPDADSPEREQTAVDERPVSPSDEQQQSGELPAPYRAPADMTILPADPVRPARKPAVRPVEQERDFRVDGFEHELRPIAAPATTRRATRAQQQEARVDDELAAAPAVTGTIAVISCAGGVGKSTLSLALADVLSRAGHGPVALVDCDAELAGLSVLAPGGGQMTRLISDPEIAAEHHATILPSGAHLYATGHHAPVLELIMQRPEILRRITERLREQYRLVILDAGAGVQNPVGRAVGEICDLAVLVSRATLASTAGMIYSYQHLRAARGLVNRELTRPHPTNVLAVINNIAEHQHADLQILKDEFLTAGLTPLLVPASATIETALEHGQFDMQQLPLQPRLALKQLVAATLKALAQ